MTTYDSRLEKLDSAVYSLHLKVPNEIAAPFIEGTNRRIICTLNDQEKIHSSFMPLGNGDWYILMNESLCRKLKLSLNDSVSIKIEKDHSEYGMDMPEELSELMMQDDLGSEYFHKLTPGKQRNLIYIVNNVKNPNGRLNKALAIIDHLKEFSGKLDFKLLNQKIKEYNSR